MGWNDRIDDPDYDKYVDHLISQADDKRKESKENE